MIAVFSEGFVLNQIGIVEGSVSFCYYGRVLSGTALGGMTAQTPYVTSCSSFGVYDGCAVMIIYLHETIIFILRNC